VIQIQVGRKKCHAMCSVRESVPAIHTRFLAVASRRLNADGARRAGFVLGAKGVWGFDGIETLSPRSTNPRSPAEFLNEFRRV
jgi:hypothetical protein